MGNKIKRDPFWDKGFTDAELVWINKIENPRSKANLLAEHAASLLLRFQDNIESLMDVALSGEAPTPQEITRIVMKLHETNYLYRTIIVEPLEKRAGKLSKENAPKRRAVECDYDFAVEVLHTLEHNHGKGNVTKDMLAADLGMSRQTLYRFEKRWGKSVM